MKVIVLHNQSLFDMALQHSGSIESIFEIILANNLSLTDEVKAGQTLIMPNVISKDNDILSYYTAKKIQPATAFTAEDKQVLERQEGISIWAINLDFAVSHGGQ